MSVAPEDLLAIYSATLVVMWAVPGTAAVLLARWSLKRRLRWYETLATMTLTTPALCILVKLALAISKEAYWIATGERF